MIDAHLAHIVWYAAMAVMLFCVAFYLGMVHQAKLDQQEREWEARRRAQEMRRDR